MFFRQTPTAAATLLLKKQMAKQWPPVHIGPARRLDSVAIHEEMFEKLFEYRIKSGARDFKLRSAGALLGADGTGKTYAALTYPCGAVRAMYKSKGWRHICVYSGPLSPREKEFIQQDGVYLEGFVLLARLVSFLSQVHRSPEVFERGGEDDHVVLDGLCADELLDIDESNRIPILEMMKKKVIQLLADLYPDVVVTVLVNIDGAEQLDEYSHLNRHGLTVAAREMLTFVRDLQQDVLEGTDGRCVLTGLLTAPKLQSNIYEVGNIGLNYEINCTPISKDAFIKLGVSYSKTVKDPCVSNEADVRLLAAALYPRVHHLRQYIESGRCDALQDSKDDGIAPPVFYSPRPKKLKTVVPPIDFTDTSTLLDQLKSCPPALFAHRLLFFIFKGVCSEDWIEIPMHRRFSNEIIEMRYKLFFNTSDTVTAVVLEEDRDLGEQLKEVIKQQTKAFWVYCGAAAPVSCIHVRKYDKELSLWYYDVKPGRAIDFAEVSRRVETLHKELTCKLGTTVSDYYHTTVITAVDFSEKEIQTNKLKYNVSVLCPSVFFFEPWTSVMYEMLRIKNKKKHNKKGSKALKRGRSRVGS